MTVLKLNGYEVPVRFGAEIVDEPVGASSRAIDGSLMSHRLASVDGHRFATGMVRRDAATALRDLLRGRGDHWGFENTVYSGKGRYQDSGSPVTTFEQYDVYDKSATLTPAAKYGTYALGMFIASTNDFAANVRDGTDESSDITGFVKINGAETTLESSTTQAKSGTRSLHLVSSANAGYGFYTEKTGLTPTDPVTASFYARAASGTESVRAWVWDTDSGDGTKITVELSTTWRRVVCPTVTVGATGTVRLYVDTPTAADIDIYCDEFQCEADTFATAWMDDTRAVCSLRYALPELRNRDSLTVMCWARRANWAAGTTGPYYCWEIVDDVTFTGIQLRDHLTTGNVEVRTTTDGTGTYAVAIEDSVNGGMSVSAWEHWAVVLRRDPVTGVAGLELYRDGVSVDSDTVTLPTLADPTLYVGRNFADGFTFGGYIDDLVVLPFALPAAMVSAFYSAGRAFSDLPVLEVVGEALAPAASPVDMIASDIRVTQTTTARPDGVAADEVGYHLSASLDDVDPTS